MSNDQEVEESSASSGANINADPKASQSSKREQAFIKGGSSSQVGSKAVKRDFAIRGFNPTITEIKLPLLNGPRTMDYVKWSRSAVDKLKSLGIHRFVLNDEVTSLDDAFADDDDHHPAPAVLRMYMIIHSRIAAALKISTVGVLGSVFFEELEENEDDDKPRLIRDYNVDAPPIDENAYLMWEQIKTKLNRRTAGDIQLLYNRIQTLSYTMGEDPLKLRKSFEELRHELYTLGFDGITDAVAKVMWLNYIPKELESIKQTIECKTDYTMDDIYNALYANYVRYNIAIKSRPSKDYSNSHHDGRDKKSHHEKKPDQQINSMTEDKRKPSSSGNFKAKGGTPQYYCNHCKKSGHTDDKCWKLEIHQLKQQLAKLSSGQPEELSCLTEDKYDYEYLCCLDQIDPYEEKITQKDSGPLKAQATYGVSTSQGLWRLDSGTVRHIIPSIGGPKVVRSFPMKVPIRQENKLASIRRLNFNVTTDNPFTILSEDESDNKDTSSDDQSELPHYVPTDFQVDSNHHIDLSIRHTTKPIPIRQKLVATQPVPLARCGVTTKAIAWNQEQYTKDLRSDSGMAQAKPHRLAYACEPSQAKPANGTKDIVLSPDVRNKYGSMIRGLQSKTTREPQNPRLDTYCYNQWNKPWLLEIDDDKEAKHQQMLADVRYKIKNMTAEEKVESRRRAEELRQYILKSSTNL